jgi:hypothetical protein
MVTTTEVLMRSGFVTGGALERAADRVTEPATLSTATIWTAPTVAGAYDMCVRPARRA